MFTRRQRLERARLYLVTDGCPSPALVDAALGGGVDIVQLRAKHASDQAVVESGRELRALCDAHAALLVVNDRPDLALACGADGVHLGQDDEPVWSVRERVGDELLIGLSTHSPDQVDAAREVDYIGVGPVYGTPTKPGVAAVGLDLVRHAAHSAHALWFAIGGIDAASARDVAAAGARRIAVVRAICEARDPSAAARQLLAALEPETVGGTAR